MLKVTVFGHDSVVDEVIAALQREGVLQVVQQSYDLPPAGVGPDDQRLRQLEEYAADARFVCDFLSRYHTPDVAFSAFISEKVHLSEQDYLALEPDIRFQRLYRECVTVADRVATSEREISHLAARVSDLLPWSGFHLQIKEWRGTEHVALFTGTVPASQGPAIREMLRQAVTDVTVEELGPVGNRQAWVVMAHTSCVDGVRAALALTDFREVSFPGLSDYPAEEIERARARVGELGEEIGEYKERARSLSSEHYHESVALVEAIDSDRDALLVREDFGTTERAFVLEGWVAAENRERLLGALESYGDTLDVAFSEPQAEDEPPVQLSNPGWLRPFETLTDLYGRPRYGKIDPTPLLAPFFFLFFAICISDVAYGAMLIIGSYLIKAKLDVAPGVKRFMDLLMLGGAGAMVVGVLFGSYFAIPFESLPPFLQSLRVLDPLKGITDFLLFAIVLGVIQVFFGVFLAAVEAFRQGDPASAVFEKLSTMFMFAMIGVAVFVPGATRWALVLGVGLTMLMQGRAISTAFGSPESGAWDRGLGIGWLAVTIGALVGLALTGDFGVVWAFVAVTAIGIVLSRTVRRSVLALLGGAYAVYGMSSFIGDILSYTRLASLSLSGALVGWVFNVLTGLVWSGTGGLFESGGLGYVWGVLVVLAAAAVFVFGHVFNVVINLLGAFVHPTRLQFVEFFSKFYEAGGESFAPFRYRTKNLVLDAGSSRQEGGTGT